MAQQIGRVFIDQLRAGDTAAWNEFIDIAKRAARLAAVRVGAVVDEPGVEDAAQQAAAKMWVLLHRGVIHPDTVRNFIWRLASNAAIDEYRRRRSARFMGDVSPDLEEFLGGEFGKAEERAIQRDLIDKAYGTLDPLVRTVHEFRYLAEMSIEETAAALTISVGTVKSRAHKGNEQIRKAFRDSGMEVPHSGRGRPRKSSENKEEGKEAQQ